MALREGPFAEVPYVIAFLFGPNCLIQDFNVAFLFGLKPFLCYSFPLESERPNPHAFNHALLFQLPTFKDHVLSLQPMLVNHYVLIN